MAQLITEFNYNEDEFWERRGLQKLPSNGRAFVITLLERLVDHHDKVRQEKEISPPPPLP